MWVAYEVALSYEPTKLFEDFNIADQYWFRTPYFFSFNIYTDPFKLYRNSAKSARLIHL